MRISFVELRWYAQVLVSGHKKHLEHCTIHKRKLDPGTVEIEGLDELEDEEEQRLAAIAEDHDAARPIQVCSL